MAGIHNAIIGTAQNFGSSYAVEFCIASGGAGGRGSNADEFISGSGGAGAPAVIYAVEVNTSTPVAIVVGAGSPGSPGGYAAPSNGIISYTNMGGAVLRGLMAGNAGPAFFGANKGGSNYYLARQR